MSQFTKQDFKRNHHSLTNGVTFKDVFEKEESKSFTGATGDLSINIATEKDLKNATIYEKLRQYSDMEETARE